MDKGLGRHIIPGRSVAHTGAVRSLLGRPGTVVLDGGLATTLEAAGHDLGGGLWSARVLRERPGAVLEVHRAFFAAGSQVATTAGYQVSGLSLERAGADPREAADLLRLGVEVAALARDEVRPDGWVAGSVGPYGASLADGSEYTGDYGLGGHAETVRALRHFHRPRMEALAAAGADVLACETVPRLAEVEALALELQALSFPAWVSLTPRAGRTRAGEPLAEAFAVLADVPDLVAAGVNCCDPRDVVPAVATAVFVTGRAGVAYPNSGEQWAGDEQAWHGSARWQPDVMVAAVAAGARLVGGCCRVSPSDIGALVASLAA